MPPTQGNVDLRPVEEMMFGCNIGRTYECEVTFHRADETEDSVDEEAAQEESSQRGPEGTEIPWIRGSDGLCVTLCIDATSFSIALRAPNQFPS